MFYLFTQTFFWLLSAFIAGFVMAWWLRGKKEVTGQPLSDDDLHSEQQYRAPPIVPPTAEAVIEDTVFVKDTTVAEKTVATKGDGQPEMPDSWAPAGLSSSPTNGKDNLKLIKGIGPKLEEKLNSLGFYRYSQLASLNSNNIDWVKARLKSSRKMPIEEWVLSAGEKLASQQAENEQDT
jgi:predicted flap endonuclease-1-like 5' DNA nuclease